MNPSVNETLLLIAWLLALFELIIALYTLLLNVRHPANRHLCALMLLFAFNNFGIGLMLGAQDVIQATWPTYLLAASTPAVQPGIVLVSVVLLAPDWLRGRWRWVFWPVYGLALLPLALTALDAVLGTQLWFTGLEASTYAGGFAPLPEFTGGSLSQILRVVEFSVMGLVAIVPALFITLTRKQRKPVIRRLAAILLITQIVALIVQFGLRNLVGEVVASLITTTAFVTAYSFAAFRQMVSEQRLQRGRLQPRLTALNLAVAVPLLVALVAFTAQRAGELIEQDASERLQSTGRALASNVSVWLDLNLQSLTQLNSLPEIISMNTEEQKPVLEAMANAHPHMYLVSTTDLNGMNVARNDDVENKDYSDRPWFQGARDGALTFQSLIGRTSGEPALVASMPILDDSGNIIGVGMFASDLTDIANEVMVSQVGESGFAYVVDANNLVIAHPDPAFSSELRDLSDTLPIAALRNESPGLVNFSEDGLRWQAHVEPMEYGWGVVVQQPVAELLSGLDQLRRIGGIVVLLGAMILSGMTWLTTRQAFRPIDSLNETVEAISAGDLTHVAPIESEDELGTLARAFNNMTQQLRDLIAGLEERVEERTRHLERRSEYLEASAQVARETTSVLDQHQLLERVASLISERFGFYHTGIFLVDESNEWAVLQAASSTGGKRMLARGHRLKVGEVGIVGFVADSEEPRVSLDVGEDAAFFDNPDLPETRSEMALPLRARGEVLGVLDVQSTEEAAFSDEDVEVLQTLADQVGVAISNARLYQQAQESAEAQRRAYGEISRAAWQQIFGTRGAWGYRCDDQGIKAVGGIKTEDSGTRLPELTLNLQARGQAIGMIQAHKPADAGDWTDEEIELLETLNEQLGLALEGARLFQETHRRAAREELIGQVTSRIRASLDLETMLGTAADEIRQALGLEDLVIKLASPTKDGGSSKERAPS